MGMTAVKTTDPPVKPIGVVLCAFGIDAVANLCDLAGGTYVEDTAAKNAGLDVVASDVRGGLRVIGAKWNEGTRIRHCTAESLKPISPVGAGEPPPHVPPPRTYRLTGMPGVDIEVAAEVGDDIDGVSREAFLKWVNTPMSPPDGSRVFTLTGRDQRRTEVAVTGSADAIMRLMAEANENARAEKAWKLDGEWPIELRGRHHNCLSAVLMPDEAAAEVIRMGEGAIISDETHRLSRKGREAFQGRTKTAMAKAAFASAPNVIVAGSHVESPDPWLAFMGDGTTTDITAAEVAAKSAEEWWGRVVGEQQSPAEFMAFIEPIRSPREAMRLYIGGISGAANVSFRTATAKYELVAKLAEYIEAASKESSH